MLAEYGSAIVVWCFFAVCFGGFIKGALGVGTPLLTVPMMALVLPPQTAIAIMSIPIVVVNLWQFAQAEHSTEVVARFWPTFIAILAGTWVGVKLLSVIDDKTLLILVGIAVIVFALVQASKFRLHLPNRLIKPVGVLFGSASGIIGGLSSFFGPMLIIYLISIRDLDKNQFVSAISFLFVSAVVPWIIALYLYGILDEQLLVYSVFATLPVLLGLYLGRHIRDHISDAIFKKVIIGILIISGFSMLWRAYH